MKKVIIYCRVSSSKQTIFGMSLDDQEFRLSSWCKQRGFEIVEIVIDVYPAKTFKKRRMISRIVKEMEQKTKRFDAIVCTSFDRFSRDVATAEEIMKILMVAKVELYTIDKRYNLNTVGGRREFVADSYRAMDDNLARAEKAESGVKQRIRMGDSPFRVGRGYKRILGNKHKDPLKRVQSKIIFDEKTLHIYQEAFRVVADGTHSGEAARRHIWNKYGLKIQKQTFYNILKNPFYMGKLNYRNDEGDDILIQGNHPAMISEETWHKVQEKLASRKREVLIYKRRNPEFPLKGFLVCPHCKRKLTAGKSKSRSGVYHYYYNCQRKLGSCKFNLKVHDVHAAFIQYLRTMTFSQSVQEAYKVILKSVFDKDDSFRINRKDEITAHVNESTSKRMSYLELFANKSILEKDYKMMIDNIENENSSLEIELAALESIESSYSKYTKKNGHMLLNINTFFWNSSIDCQNELLDFLIVRDFQFDKVSILNLKINPTFRILTQNGIENGGKESSNI